LSLSRRRIDLGLRKGEKKRKEERSQERVWPSGGEKRLRRSAAGECGD
jgi:hypothetical protein